MTLEEYHTVIGWQKAGRLDVNIAGLEQPVEEWRPWDLVVGDRSPGQSPPNWERPFSMFRERPAEPEMPDVLWVARHPGPGFVMQCTGYASRVRAELVGKPVRYVRADGVIDGRRLLCRTKGKESWSDIYCAGDLEYRFKP